MLVPVTEPGTCSSTSLPVLVPVLNGAGGSGSSTSGEIGFQSGPRTNHASCSLVFWLLDQKRPDVLFYWRKDYTVQKRSTILRIIQPDATVFCLVVDTALDIDQISNRLAVQTIDGIVT